MADALGLLETRSFAAMVEGADAMVKAAKVELVSYETTGGGSSHRFNRLPDRGQRHQR